VDANAAIDVKDALMEGMGVFGGETEEIVLQLCRREEPCCSPLGESEGVIECKSGADTSAVIAAPLGPRSVDSSDVLILDRIHVIAPRGAIEHGEISEGRGEEVSSIGVISNRTGLVVVPVIDNVQTEVPAVEDVRLIDVGEDVEHPALAMVGEAVRGERSGFLGIGELILVVCKRSGEDVTDLPGGEDVIDIMIVVECESDLLEMVVALDATCGLAGLLDGREQQRDQDRDNRDHHEQFNERKASFAMRSVHGDSP